MAITSGALNKAILARIRGTETSPGLTGDQTTAQAALIALIPTWRLGNLTASGTFPRGVLWNDAGIDAMPRAIDVGIITQTVRRFELWFKTSDESKFDDASKHLERLFDYRQAAPLLEPAGDGLVEDMSLLTEFQGPFFDPDSDAWWGTMAFWFLEARP